MKTLNVNFRSSVVTTISSSQVHLALSTIPSICPTAGRRATRLPANCRKREPSEEEFSRVFIVLLYQCFVFRWDINRDATSNQCIDRLEKLNHTKTGSKIGSEPIFFVINSGEIKQVNKLICEKSTQILPPLTREWLFNAANWRKFLAEECKSPDNNSSKVPSAIFWRTSSQRFNCSEDN